MNYDAYDAILHHVFEQTHSDAWLRPAEDNIAGGVCIRIRPDHFRSFPYDNPHHRPFQAAVRALNPIVAVKIRSPAVNAALNSMYVPSSL